MLSSRGAGQDRRPRRLLVTALWSAVAAAALVAGAPSVVGLLAPSLIEDAFERRYAGSLEVRAVQLAWWGRTTVGPVALFDAAGTRVAELSAQADANAWRLLRAVAWRRAPLDLGSVFVSGELELERDDDGRTTLQRAVEPRSLPGAEGRASSSFQLPSARPIQLSLRLDRLSVDIADTTAAEAATSRPDVRLRDLTGTLEVDLGEARARVEGALTGAVDGGAASRQLEMQADVIVDRDPAAGLRGARAVIALRGVPVTAIDILSGMRGALVESIGSTAEATLRLESEQGTGTLEIDARAPRALVEVTLALSDGVLTAPRGARAQIASSSLLSAIPFFARTARRMRPTQWPSLTLELDTLSLPVGNDLERLLLDAGTLDWRGSRLALRIETGEAVGQLDLVRDGGGDTQRLVIEPGQLIVEVDGLDSGVAIRGETRATVDGVSAGSSTIDLVVRDLLDESGRLRDAFGAIDGQIVQLGLESGVLQAILDGAGVPLDARRDIGPQLDELVVTARSSSSDRSTDLQLRIRAAYLEASAAARLEGRVLESRGEGWVLELRRAGPMLRRLVAGPEDALLMRAWPVREGATARLQLTKLRIDLSSGATRQAVASGRLEGRVRNPGAQLSDSADGDELAVALRRLAAEVIGDELTLVFEVAESARPNAREGLPIRAAIGAKNADARIEARLEPTGFKLARATGAMEISPQRASALLGAATGSAIRIVEPIRLSAERRPGARVQDPVDGAALPSADEAFHLALTSSPWVVEGLPGLEADQRFALEPEEPLMISRQGGVPAGGDSWRASLIGRLSARSRDGPAEVTEASRIDARATYQTASGSFGGELRATDLAALIAAALDLESATVQDAVGARPSLAARAVRADAVAPLRISLDWMSPRIEANEIGLVWDDARVRLPKPARIRWTPTDATLGRLLMGSDSGVRQASAITLEIAEAAFAGSTQDDAAGPLHSDTFALDATLGARSLVLEAASGAEVVARDLQIQVRSAAAQRGIVFDAQAERISADGALPPEPTIVRGTLADIADARGFPSLGEARLTAAGDLQDFPSVLIDNLGQLNGFVDEAFGPYVTIALEADGVSRHSGSLRIDARALRSTAQIQGDIRDGVFVASETTRWILQQIRPALVDKLVWGMPFISAFEKKPEDGPASLIAEGLTAPLDGDMRKLNGVLRVEMGRVRFESALLGKVLELARGATDRHVAREFRPFVVTAERGVLSYEEYVLPIGNEELATSGTVDLADQSIDMVLYVPYFMLAEEMTSAVNTGLGALIPSGVPVIGRLTRLPIRVRGPLSAPRIAPDLALFVRQQRDALLRPDKVLRKLPGT
jgi:hypothetical protein